MNRVMPTTEEFCHTCGSEHYILRLHPRSLRGVLNSTRVLIRWAHDPELAFTIADADEVRCRIQAARLNQNT